MELTRKTELKCNDERSEIDGNKIQGENNQEDCVYRVHT